MTAAANDRLDFFTRLLAAAPADLWGYLWTRQDLTSHWLQVSEGPQAFADLAGELAEGGSDVYVGCALAREPLGPRRRGSADTTAAILGLWADVDVRDADAHKKLAYPPTTDAALSIVEAGGVTPTITVHSGHGIQCWWLFSEAWEFSSDTERVAAAELSYAWNTTLRVRGTEVGLAHPDKQAWVVDSTYDLSRVLRVPGTTNYKPPEAPVEMIAVSDLRYSSEDFGEHLVDDAALRELGVSSTPDYVVGALRLDPKAQPDLDMLEALRANNEQFEKSWTRKRRDLADQSASSYDLSLASIAVAAGWSDQEVVNLMIAGRRQHGDDLKITRQDYYARTIARAHEQRGRVEAAAEMDEAVDALRTARRDRDDEAAKDARRDALDTVSRQLGIIVLGVIKFMSSPPTYRIKTPSGGVNLTAAELTAWASMRTKIAEAEDIVIGRFKGDAWDAIVQTLLAAVEEHDVGVEATEKGQLDAWISRYLESQPPAFVDDEAAHAQALREARPFVGEDGAIYIFGMELRNWLYLAQGERITNQLLGRMLQTNGITTERVTVRLRTGRTTRSLWRLPPSRWSVNGVDAGPEHVEAAEAVVDGTTAADEG